MKGVNISLAFNMETVYSEANFQINDNDKVGIVGVNGAGKTTLFKVLLKEISLDSGQIVIAKQKRIGYLPQEIILEDKGITVFDYLMTARPIAKLEQQLAHLYEQVAIETNTKEQNKLLREIGETQELLEYYDCYQAENILFEIMDSMHIGSHLLDMKLKDLSGGQKSKIAFAHLLYSKPEILLLDEPTNHLDVETREYIIEYLQNYAGTVLIISHDVTFLNSIIDCVMYIDKANRKIKMYQGSYTTFQKKLADEKEIKERFIDKQEKEEEKLREFILLYSNSSGKRKRIAQSREKMLAKKLLDKVDRDKTVKKVKLNIKPNREGSKIPLKVNNVEFSYPNNKIVDNLSFLINNRERFLIVGENGVGKSTLLKLIMGILKPQAGQILFGSKTDIAYYAQEQELLDLDKTIVENVDSPEFSENELRTVLGSFLFFGDDVFKKASVLSPGEKARIALCKVMLQKANLLLLDEPTNHLDPDTQKIIGENFRNYEGTIIIVSHNPSFVESIGIDRMLILPSGKITNYSEELLDYYYKKNSN